MMMSDSGSLESSARAINAKLEQLAKMEGLAGSEPLCTVLSALQSTDAVLKGGQVTPPPGLPYPNLFLQQGAPTPRDFGDQDDCASTVSIPQGASAFSQQADDPSTPGQPWPSKGSVNHPHACAGACRYVKRKGGCRDAENCTMCHLCFWKREQKQPPPPTEDELADIGCPPCSTTNVQDSSSQPLSVGTIGHPYTCNAPCRHIRRKFGCRDGVHCVKCHTCKWQRGLDEPAAATPPQPAAEAEEGQKNPASTLQDLIRLQLYAMMDAPGKDEKRREATPVTAANATPVTAANV